MAENVQSMMLEILKKLQTDTAGNTDRLGRIEDRLGKLEEQGKKHRADSAAMLVMMRATVRDFNERMTDVEDDIRYIKRKS